MHACPQQWFVQKRTEPQNLPGPTPFLVANINSCRKAPKSDIWCTYFPRHCYSNAGIFSAGDQHSPWLPRICWLLIFIMHFVDTFDFFQKVVTRLQCKFLLLERWFPFIFHFLCETERCKFHFMEKKLPSNWSFWFHPQSFTFYLLLMSLSMHILYIHTSVNPTVYFCYCLLHFFFCCCQNNEKFPQQLSYIGPTDLYHSSHFVQNESTHVILNIDLFRSINQYT